MLKQDLKIGHDRYNR